ncbi:MAG: sodium-translocating pyrophosphatase [Deltaproteobacteria bacterium]|nr:sodium-translocating pyrophosphatase [Deltaproteobacteria bacterium]
MNRNGIFGTFATRWTARVLPVLGALAALLVSPAAFASEAELKLPDLGDTNLATFFGLSGHSLLVWGIAVCLIGFAFGIFVFVSVKKLPVHKSMLEMSELIFETCKTYLLQQGKFLAILEILIGAIIVAYFGLVSHMEAYKVAIILGFSVVGILGSYGVAWFGIRINTFANSRTAFASLAGKGYPCYGIPLKSGMSIGTLLISTELIIMLIIMLFLPADLAGPCFIGFAIGESLGASALRIAGGIFTKIADIGSDLMKIVFKVKEDDARNPGVIADCTGDNAGDSVGPTADGFETYGVTGVALITFIMLAVADPSIQVQLLVWIFAMRVAMIVTSIGSYFINDLLVARPRYGNAVKFNYEIPLTTLVFITSIISIGVTFLLSYLLIGPGNAAFPNIKGNGDLWWQLSLIISCGTAAGALIPEVVKVFTSVHSKHVKEVVNSSKEGGASLNILSGLVAGNFSGYWMGIMIVGLMAIAYLVSGMGLNAALSPDANIGDTMAAVFAFGLVAFGFLGMGPVTIAVDSYGPVTDNAQSIYELSLIETQPNAKEELKKEFGIDVNFEMAKELLEENDGAGNTFKATAKPVLIGTAVVGATTMIFSIIMALTNGLQDTAAVMKLSLTYAPFVLGLVTGGAMIYWFTGASMQAVVAGAYKAVEFIKRNMKLDGAEKASTEDSKKVVAICTQYAQKGMWNIFLAVFFATLAFACVEPYFFIGYLIAIAIFGLYQAVFMANAGGAWDNAKKIVETSKELAAEGNGKGSALHEACVVGDTVGDPYKDTSSVAMNPIIKFTTLFGLLAVEMAVGLIDQGQRGLTTGLAILFFVISAVFVWRSFYTMRITSGTKSAA